jgi:hypothetical protein
VPTPDHDIVDAGRIDPGARDGSVDDMGGELRRVGVVEGTLVGTGDAGSGGGNDGGFTHDLLSRRM